MEHCCWSVNRILITAINRCDRVDTRIINAFRIDLWFAVPARNIYPQQCAHCDRHGIGIRRGTCAVLLWCCRRRHRHLSTDSLLLVLPLLPIYISTSHSVSHTICVHRTCEWCGFLATKSIVYTRLVSTMIFNDPFGVQRLSEIRPHRLRYTWGGGGTNDGQTSRTKQCGDRLAALLCAWSVWSKKRAHPVYGV